MINTLKKVLLITALLVLAVMSVFIYMNSHYYYLAGSRQDVKLRIAQLERSNALGFLNDLIFYELGKSHFELGLESVGEAAESEAHFKKAVESLKKCILINPASPYSHFYLGQSLLHLDLLFGEKNLGYLNEFRNAAILAGDDYQIYREVGRLFLSRWPELSERDRSFELYLLKKTLAKNNSEEIAKFLGIWELNAKDYRIMDEVLPSNAQAYRQYAEFLGEKSLSLEERHKYLSLAEFLDFEKAKQDYQVGDNLMARFQLQEAFGRLKSSLDLLRGIRFYQTLHTETLIDKSEYQELLKSSLLSLAKCRIEGRAAWEEIEGYLMEYLSLEDRGVEVEELAAYLRDRGLITEKPGRSSGDLSRLALELLLQFKQNKYREIVNFGRDLQLSFMVVPEAERLDYVGILQLIGDSMQKVDFLYDAGDVYAKALDIDPNNLEAMLKIRQNYIRLSEDRKLREIDRAIERLVTSGETDLSGLSLHKGMTMTRSLVFDGQNIDLGLQFAGVKKDEPPLVGVFFNGQVVWEDFVKEGRVSLRLTTKIGENILQMKAINRPVSLGKFICSRHL